MRAIMLTSIVLVALYALGPGVANAGAAYQATMGELAAPMGPMSYQPAYLTVSVGDTVTWTNTGAKTHQVELHIDGDPVGDVPTVASLANPANPPNLDHNNIAPGHSFSYTFTEKGVYVVNCNLGTDHMSGKQVIVVN